MESHVKDVSSMALWRWSFGKLPTPTRRVVAGLDLGGMTEFNKLWRFCFEHGPDHHRALKVLRAWRSQAVYGIRAGAYTRNGIAPSVSAAVDLMRDLNGTMQKSAIKIPQRTPPRVVVPKRKVKSEI